MTLRLVNGVQVRKQNWGLLFYTQTQHRLFFVRSRDWLFPQHFDGTWNSENLVKDISLRNRARRKEFSQVCPHSAKRYRLPVPEAMMTAAST
jgi:hypothetical protein